MGSSRNNKRVKTVPPEPVNQEQNRPTEQANEGTFRSQRDVLAIAQLKRTVARKEEDILKLAAEVRSLKVKETEECDSLREELELLQAKFHQSETNKRKYK